MADLLKSRINKVQVYRSGALVTRVVDDARADWPEEIVLGPLPLSIEDDSVRAQMIADNGDSIPAQVLDLEVELVAPKPKKIEQDIEQKVLEQAEQDLTILHQRLERLQEQHEVFAELELSLAERFEDKAPQPLSAQVWREGLDWQHKNKSELLEKKLQLQQEIENANEKVHRAERAINEALAAQQPDLNKLHKRLRLRVKAAVNSGPCRLQFSYLLRAAQWRPAYVLRVQPDNQSAELTMRAMISQGSGEPWDAVQLDLSTATWQRHLQLPKLKSKRMGRAQPQSKKGGWREPPQDGETLFADYDRALQQEPSPTSSRQKEMQDGGGEDLMFGSAAPKGAIRSREIEFIDELTEFDEEMDSGFEPEYSADAASDEPPEMEMVFVEEESCAEPEQPSPMMSKSAMSKSRMAPPAPMKKSMSRKKMRSAPQNMLGGAAMNRALSAPQAPVPEPDKAPKSEQLNYPGFIMQGWEHKKRGQLRPVVLGDRLDNLSQQELRDVAMRLNAVRKESMELENFEPRTVSLSSSAGSYDYSYRASGRVSIPGDGKLHNVPVLSASSSMQMTLVVVPRESTQAVRVANLTNPLHSPLLSGPVEVYLQREFLVDTELKTLPSGAKFDVGLGAEEAIKVARNTHYKEETQGLLGGDLALQHKVSIEIASGLAQDVMLEVRERIPVRDDETDKDIKISIGDVEPKWEDWTQSMQDRLSGGKRWRLSLAAGEKKKLHYSYHVEIDSKDELIGGNRREELRQ